MRKADRARKKGRVGSSFDDFLKEDGLYEEVTTATIERVVSRQFPAPRDQGSVGDASPKPSLRAKRSNPARAKRAN
jgi:hypothetical protein